MAFSALFCASLGVTLAVLLQTCFVDIGISGRRTYTEPVPQGACDLVIRLGLGESFEFAGDLPAQLHQSRSHYGYHRSGRPQECSWVFVARSIDGVDCQLEYRQMAPRTIYNVENGGIGFDCNEQYFIFGDENHEERYCGPKKLPHRLNSTGSQLFISHFRRNGHGRYESLGAYISSLFGGIVKCRARPQPVPACAPPPRFCTSVPDVPCHGPGPCTMSLRITRPVKNQTSSITCDPGPDLTCVSTGQVCFTAVPANSSVPQLPPPPGMGGAPNCTEPIQIICPLPGNCSPFFSWELITNTPDTFHDFKIMDQVCFSDPAYTCVFQGNSCFTRFPLNNSRCD